MAEFDQDLPVQVIAALERGQKIEAIKLLRELKGIGLKEAKEAVDGYTLERQPDGVSVVQSGGHGGIFWLLGLLVLGAAVAWLLGAF
ncbi:ribosomal protein L7/L12 [Pseudomonas anguilliseptica]|uniref:Ribosomal protein L7/L12 C-terminal domain-containing protein n=1 Tax=Pseudomonas anguilliseptica TaxID=53406 RepID=A0A1H5LDB3_PSEAG|nr:ribosomal protein L7/L12 [Pseudomonas anguilliseptica]SEE75042.1 Ribosomal protein L7/L12 C-terminal domain-containing protein [Pseudomonas anguilliseptica]